MAQPAETEIYLHNLEKLEKAWSASARAAGALKRKAMPNATSSDEPKALRARLKIQRGRLNKLRSVAEREGQERISRGDMSRPKRAERLSSVIHRTANRIDSLIGQHNQAVDKSSYGPDEAKALRARLKIQRKRLNKLRSVAEREGQERISRGDMSRPKRAERLSSVIHRTANRIDSLIGQHNQAVDRRKR